MAIRALKDALFKNTFTKKLYVDARALYHRTKKISYFIYDILIAYRFMRWSGQDEQRYWAASAELLFQYHKLEKGLCMPGPARFFGYDPSSATLDLLSSWRKKGYDQTDTVYLGALATLKSYAARIANIEPERSELLRARIFNELESHAPVSNIQTPINTAAQLTPNHAECLADILSARRSQRVFSAQAVSLSLVSKAISMAQLSPSACNRQPWRVHIYEDKAKMTSLLELQNGNRGFGQTIPMLLIITSESQGFFDASERHEPYVDGGLFAMSLLLALQSLGLSTCCLNWCVSPSIDKQAHVIGGIAPSELIIMYLAVGYAEPSSLVPASPRRDIKTLLIKH